MKSELSTEERVAAELSCQCAMCGKNRQLRAGLCYICTIGRERIGIDITYLGDGFYTWEQKS